MSPAGARALATLRLAALVLPLLVVAVGCGSGETEERPSMPADRLVRMDSMPTGIPQDSMEAQMRRIYQGERRR